MGIPRRLRRILHKGPQPINSAGLSGPLDRPLPSATGGRRIAFCTAMKSRLLSAGIPLRLNRQAVCFCAALSLFALLFSVGCNRDPKKFLAKGNQSFDQGKYPDAIIYYGRALQLDPRFAEAHFKMARTHLRMKSWSAAFAELRRTVELQPDNWEAQLDLGRLELGVGQKNDAKERAQLVLKSNPTNADAQLLLADSDAALGNSKEALDEAAQAVEMSPDRASSY